MRLVVVFAATGFFYSKSKLLLYLIHNLFCAKFILAVNVNTQSNIYSIYAKQNCYGKFNPAVTITATLQVVIT